MRLRFAPSPTGDLHLGNARTAILNWLIARHNNGKFVLRVEDTDTDRNLKDAEKGIYEALKWMGLDWDEGPDVGGDSSPYRQSEAKKIYSELVTKLIENGYAYECYCTPEELEIKKEKAMSNGESPIYDRKCLNITDEQKQSYKKEGRIPVVRFKVRAGEVRFVDKIKGEVRFDTDVISDFIIMRSNGMPTYNFAVVVDDMRMNIDLILRGDDHLTNTPKQIMLYEAFQKILDDDIKIPNFGHLPMILGPDKSKLSKRHGAVSVFRTKNEGFLPEALINFLSLLGWNRGSDQEIYSIDELIKIIDVSQISSSASIFDFDKFKWLNHQYMKNITEERYLSLVIPFIKNSGWKLFEDEKLINIALLVRDSVRYGKEVLKWTELFFKEIEPDKLEEDSKQILLWDSSKTCINEYMNKLSELSEFTEENVFGAIKAVQKEFKIKGKFLYMPLRVAITGMAHGPDLVKSILIMGKNKVLTHLNKTMEKFYEN